MAQPGSECDQRAFGSKHTRSALPAQDRETELDRWSICDPANVRDPLQVARPREGLV